MIPWHGPREPAWRGKGIAEWTEGHSAFVSVIFTWLLPAAYGRCVWLSAQGYAVEVGGPAVSLHPDYLRDVARIGNEANALPHHNPQATITSRGCIRQCPFCAVPIIEGPLVELPDWEPRPIVYDNNLLACSRRHFDRVIDSLKPLRGVDFNQGLDARLMTEYHAQRLAELRLAVARLSWDCTDEPYVMAAIDNLLRAGIARSRIQVYVLVGFEDGPEDAWYRCEVLKAHKVRLFVMRYQPLWSMRRNEYIAPDWTAESLTRFTRYWNRQNWLSSVPFEEYQRGFRAQPTNASARLI